MGINVRSGMAYVHSVYTAVSRRTYAEGGTVCPAATPHADGLWVWLPTHPRDTDGDPA